MSNVMFMIMSVGVTMGLFDKFKGKKSDEENNWVVNKKRGNIVLSDKYVVISTVFPNKEDIVFYKDITMLERKLTYVIIKTNSSEFDIAPMSIRGAEDKAKELHLQLLDKVAEYK